MKAMLIAIAVAACGGSQHPDGGGGGGGGGGSGSAVGNTDPTPGPVKDTRSELEKRRDAACKQIGPKLTSCALEDAKADLAAGKVKKADFDRDTAKEVLEKNTAEFFDKCSHSSMSSRQVRVLEVCFREENECGPLRDCLSNLDPKK